MFSFADTAFFIQKTIQFRVLYTWESTHPIWTRP